MGIEDTVVRAGNRAEQLGCQFNRLLAKYHRENAPGTGRKSCPTSGEIQSSYNFHQSLPGKNTTHMNTGESPYL